MVLTQSDPNVIQVEPLNTNNIKKWVSSVL